MDPIDQHYAIPMAQSQRTTCVTSTHIYTVCAACIPPDSVRKELANFASRLDSFGVRPVDFATLTCRSTNASTPIDDTIYFTLYDRLGRLVDSDWYVGWIRFDWIELLKVGVNCEVYVRQTIERRIRSHTID